MASCARPGCDGAIDADGYCDTCGLAAQPGVATVGAAAATGPATAAISASEAGPATAALSPTVGAAGPATVGTVRPATAGIGPPGTASSVTSSTASSRSRRTSTRTSRGGLGAGLVEVPPVPQRDPAEAIMKDPVVPESKRVCSRCEQPVGRGHDGKPGRAEGFCRNCGAKFDFTPKLKPGDLVGGQYEVLGCLAHGGLGWIYLARDHNVHDRWVVLKGLLNTGDTAAMAAAVAERRFLAEVEHPHIVKIYNFVQHPDAGGTMVGYIVMEYVGGKSLKQLRGATEPMPVEQALAYALEVLPAMGYLHGSGLLYCDFKPENVIQTAELVKLIDLGAVRHVDDFESDIWGTVGYQAPEIAPRGAGPSIASDLYTVGRTLAVLTANFDFRKRYLTSLPDAVDVPLYVEHESFYRLLRRATHRNPDLRFATAAEMAEQLVGVLRETVASGRAAPPPPRLSTLFSPERHTFGSELDEPLDLAEVATALPVPLVDGSDPAAPMLATLTATEPAELLAALGTVGSKTAEVQLRCVRAQLELGDLDAAAAALNLAVPLVEADDWRVPWYRGLIALAGDRAADAFGAFDAVYDAIPGELAPKLALAVAAEHVDRAKLAARYHEIVWSTDHTFVSAAFGLARVRMAAGDVAGAVAVLESVPESSSHYVAAQVASVKARIGSGTPGQAELLAAADRLTNLRLDAQRLSLLRAEVLERALDWVRGNPTVPDGQANLLGCQFAEPDLRFGLERTYRALARLTDSTPERIRLVDRANSIRPRTLV